MGRAVRSSLVALILAACACAAGEAGRVATARPSRPRPSPSALPSASDSAARAEPDAGTIEAGPAEPPPPPVRFPGTTFPPPDLAPPFERSAQPGDGEWVRLGDAARGERLAADPATMFKTVLHPHPVSRWIKVTVVAIDLRHVSVGYVPGSQDVEDLKTDEDDLPLPPGLVPEADRDALLVVFNGGFKPRHGNWGMKVRHQTLVPPRQKGCTVGLRGDGSVVIGSWIALAGAGDELVSYRQTPPCLVEHGEMHPDLEAHRDRAWGGHDPNRKTRRRSALGVDGTGRILLYGMGDEAEPRELARGMRHAGAVAAAELDINWSWTRFLIFGRSTPDAELEVTSTLVPQTVHRRTGYVERPAGRDFFYVTRRASTDVGNAARRQ